MSGTILIGVGNADCGDDGAGREVARRLRDRFPGARVLELSGESSELIMAWAGADRVVLVDACASGDRPGSLRRLDLSRPLPVSLLEASTHGFGVDYAVELARVLGLLPAEAFLYAVSGRRFTPGATLSPEVEAALPGIVDRIGAELAAEPCAAANVR